jgi:putative inorganic carbon (hco3(-)) transporter
MSFFLLILVTAILFIRPTDFVPQLESAQLFLVSILACLASSFHVIPPQLSAESLRRRPITVCVVGLLLVNLLSCLVNLCFDLLITQTFEFAKVVLFYLLLLGLVDSPRRLRLYLLSTASVLVVQTGLAVLQYYEYIHLAAFVPLGIDPDTGEKIWTGEARLRGTGLFGDPNDVCLPINLGIILSLYALLSARSILFRLFWLGPLTLFALALQLTGSRGGLMGALAGVAVLLLSKFGIRKGLIMATVALPLILGMIGGRQLDFNLGDRENTGLKRIQLWSNAIEVFKSSPVLGVGPAQTADYLDDHPVHNSFVQPFSDMGFLGGTLFVGAFYHAFRRLLQFQLRPDAVRDPTLTLMRPFITAAMTGYVITAMSLNFTYIMSTYAILGIAAAYVHLADSDRPPPGESIDARMVQRFICVSILFLTLTILYIKMYLKY